MKHIKKAPCNQLGFFPTALDDLIDSENTAYVLHVTWKKNVIEI